MAKEKLLPGAESLVREGDEAFAWWRELMPEGGPPPCVVRHPDAGGQCERAAVMEVYGLAFCEAHGAEAKAGALEANLAIGDATHACTLDVRNRPRL